MAPVQNRALELLTALKISTVSLVLQLTVLLAITQQRQDSGPLVSALPALQVKFALATLLEFIVVSKDISALV